MQGTISCARNYNMTTTVGESLRPLSLKTQGNGERVRMVVEENAVIVIGRRGCCMCHVVRRLLLGLGVNPAVLEIDEEREDEVLSELENIGVQGGGGTVKLPAVYVGGRLFGGLDRVMATHISGELVPILKEVGALWL
ncbi:Glutaredoxin-C9 [Arabidopsis thaliana]|uniref:Glutaredoxin-C9 n=4 Tax=Arabidopsis TaxID=3701 RepID=GRXC9_ARATH|nr:Thioredoxin superfamily protein [Arabidopsis thaliana]Q9SGP6.1 RecName: Full=Glutaredoxin-C9; Short=AtGrxC9; AltName: Full=Protein ROXY 19 [Arabidopsis thaliana]KAG7647838.1 Glutaredoxin [Arabidopsis thaliana x Arabidopsis arenosa]KAG7655767.1 Glutaredoxin [Arabidopsis suecica]AAF16751.1 F3M18.8 [Arabidopsis thaliana]AAG40382.1 At1g28480 [Arabidopsis thaliana]ABK32150.1 At1g28480 [Arabidopsis thaliana]|eukprot:NP_174170.1 Thioredoxin superfamily protein [Arabidopsis thaliana]